MKFSHSACLAVQESSQVGQARRAASTLARTLGFDETDAGKVGIVVTELAKNLVRHARGGQLLLRPVDEGFGPGIEILAIDSGPGMADVGKSLQDGYSTVGTPGTGLGAIVRSATMFDVYSQPGSGTVMVARLFPQAQAVRGLAGLRSFEVGAVCMPRHGETVPGDAWTFVPLKDRAKLMVADGLGHGPDAAQAATEAVRAFWENTQESTTTIVQRIHGALAHTRGAALGIMELDPGSEVVRFTGVGNIAGRVLDTSVERNLVSNHGTVGHAVRVIREFEYRWSRSSVVVISSDGLLSRWSLDAYPGLRVRHAALIAGVLYRDFARGNDDVTVVVLREQAGTGVG